MPVKNPTPPESIRNSRSMVNLTSLGSTARLTGAENITSGRMWKV